MKSPSTWPEGGFQWKPKWREQLPVMRGVRVLAVPNAEAELAQPLMLHKDHYSGTLAAYAAKLGRAIDYPAAESDQPLDLQQLRRADFDFWLDSLLQVRCDHQRGNADRRLIRIAAAMHAPAFGVRVLLTVVGVQDQMSYDFRELIQPLREAVARADDAAYAEATAVAESFRGRSEMVDLTCAAIFADRTDWVEAWNAQHEDVYAVLHDCAMTPAGFRAYLDKLGGRVIDKVLPSGVLLQLHQHGDAATDGVAQVLARHLDEPWRSPTALQLAAEWHVPAMPMLLARVAPEWAKAHDALRKLAARHPVGVMAATLQHALSGRSRAAELCAMRFAMSFPQAWAAALDLLEPGPRARAEAMRALREPEEATADAVPRILREPPWLQADRPGSLPALDIAARSAPATLAWPDGLRDRMLVREPSFSSTKLDDHGFPSELQLTPAGARRLLSGQLPEPGDCGATWASPSVLDRVPGVAQLPLWLGMPPKFWAWDDYLAGPILSVLARHGDAGVPAAVRVLQGHRGKGPSLANVLDAPELVDDMTHLLRNSRLVPRDNAIRWIRRFPRTVLLRTLPQAFAAEHSAVRDNARHVIRWLAEQGEREAVLAIAAEHGEAVADATGQLLDTDPLYVLPGEMPPLPAFFEPAAFRRPLLRTGGGVPLAAVAHLGQMLRLSPPDGATYPGIGLAQAACTRESLADFAWDVFEAWIADGMPAKEQWAYRALGLVGDDETARRLVPRINDWALQQGTRPKAMLGLQMLAAIGTDVSLMLLNTQSAKGKNKRVQERAGEMIADVAERRGMTRDELSDRLVPTLGLEGESGSILDFGPRRFTIAFDEELKPFVRDAQGARLKDLPKPNKADDTALSAAAVARFKDLKKDVKTIAGLQVTRLERAMLLRRRWRATDFRQLFTDHPLARHLAARLAWAVCDEQGRCVRALRVAEDWSLADARDQAFPLDPDALVALPHVLELPAAERDAISQVFAEYEIAQPFRQLARETFALSAAERTQAVLERWKGKDVAAGSLLGLAQRTWERGDPQDGGMICSYWRDTASGLRVEFEFEPGIFVGGGMPDYRQGLGRAWVTRPGAEPGAPTPTFGDLDPIDASEVIRDLESLAPARDDVA